jgi:redox-sensitive bicupin YhaK (pirin superfamily)
MTIRQIQSITTSRPTLEGAGVHLRRAFGFGNTADYDPFLLLDDFRGDDPAMFKAGFPWHPHRGIETITYMLEGTVEHQDSLGNKGIIGPGDVQWMTAGSGIIHQEMPLPGKDGRMGGFQLWANLPANQKMMEPRYRDVRANEIPEVALPGGGCARVIAGVAEGVKGPVGELVILPEYLDIRLPAGARFQHTIPEDHHSACYIIDGYGDFSPDDPRQAGNHDLVLYGKGTEMQVQAGVNGVRFLLINGKPLGEPIAWYGPIVMNTQEEIQLAMRELRNDTFIKNGGKQWRENQ